MPIAYRSTSTPATDTHDPTSVTLPPSTTTGDVTIISSVCAQTSTAAGAATATVPAGWTVIANTPGFLVCYRVYQAGDPTSISITWGSPNWKLTSAVSYSGCDTSNPIDGSNYCLGANEVSATPVMRAPSVAPRYASGKIVCVYAYGLVNSGQTITLPGGLTSRAVLTQGPTLTIADAANGSTNAPTGNKQATIGSTTGSLAFGCQILLKDSAATALTQADNFLNTAAVFQQTTVGGASIPTFSLDALGRQVGDLILLPIASLAATVTPPTGWTTLRSSSDGILCYRVAQAGDTATPAITLSASANTCYELVLLRPAYPLTSGSVSVDASGQNALTNSATVTTPSLVPFTTADFLALFAASNGGSNAWTLSAGPTRDLSSSGGVSTQFGWEQPSANPSGSFTWTASGTQTTLTGWSVLARLPSPPVPPVMPRQMIIT